MKHSVLGAAKSSQRPVTAAAEKNSAASTPTGRLKRRRPITKRRPAHARSTAAASTFTATGEALPNNA